MRRTIELAAWSIVAAMGLLATTQTVGWTGLSIVYVAQAMTPYLLTPAIPIAVVAARFERSALAFVSAAVACCLLWLTMPVVFHDRPVPAAAGGVQLTIAHANVYRGNSDAATAAAALLATDADVIAVTEYSDRFGRRLRDQGIAATHPYVLARDPGDRDGVAMFSRHRIASGEVALIGHQLGIEATLDVHGTAVRVFVVHPLPAVDQWSLRRWRDDLPTIGDRALASTLPTVLVGDFNASRWHPAFRSLLDRGLDDAHELLGRGFSVSWPTGYGAPTFVRLDHALVTDRLTPTAISDIDVPGSDHRGFVVAVATT